MLVEHRVDADGTRVQPGLVREGGRPDVRLTAVGRHVGELADRVRHPRCLPEPALRQHQPGPLELQVGDHGEDVGVAGPLAVAVERPLHVGCAGVHGRERVGDCTARVVVAVDAEPGAGRLAHRVHDVGHLVGQPPAVGVAEHRDVRSRLDRDPEHLQRVRRVGRVAVEEVLRVEEDPPPLGAQVRHRVLDHREVLVQRGAQGQLDVAGVALGHQGDHACPGVTQGGHLGVVGGLRTGSAGRAERGELRSPQVELGPSSPEELRVLRVGTRPPALDEAHPERVEVGGHRQLVLHREGQALLLGAVAQRRVVDVELVGAHAALPNKKDPPRSREVCASAGSVRRRAQLVMQVVLIRTESATGCPSAGTTVPPSGPGRSAPARSVVRR